ncbi:MAG: hypothetical protein EOP37_23700 [Rubrivivax sp.]|nr:MAG: hypothetical protein EOP37_23700 [Rubrivivax sp.]
MKNFHLFWTGGNEPSPTSSEVCKRVRVALMKGGVVTFDADGDLDRSRSLQVRAEIGRSLLTFGWDDGVTWNMRAFVHASSRGLDGSSSLLGDVWLNRLIFDDADAVVDLFRKFLDGVEPCGLDWT